jgi:chaperonin GroES
MLIANNIFLNLIFFKYVICKKQVNLIFFKKGRKKMALSNEKIKSIRPLQDRILIEKIVENDSTTSGGIFIPEVAKEKPQIGKVIAVGAGKVLNNGVVQPMSVKVGDVIFFSKFAGTELSSEYLLIREDEALAVV